MQHIVSDLQTCSVRGYCIRQNVWSMSHSTESVIELGLLCGLVSFDQQSFDMVDYDFLMKVLEKFGLNPNVCIGFLVYTPKV